MNERLRRLWRLVSTVEDGGAYPKKHPNCTGPPSMLDTLMVAIMLENSRTAKEFEQAVSRNQSLLRWADRLSDEMLRYLISLQRHLV